MKKRLLHLTVASCVVLALLFKLFTGKKIPGSGGRSDSEISARLEQYLAEREASGFSGVVLVSKGDELLFEKYCGLADREKQIPFDHSIVFTVGSISKQFTGAAVMQLVMDGRLRVDDTIDQYFVGVPKDKRKITIHQLLTHTAGFPNSLGDDFDIQATRERMIEQAMNIPLLSQPGQKHRYSNTGYGLLAAIIELVSQESYEEFLRSRLFEPVGMLDTGIVLPQYPPERLAAGYKGAERWGTLLERPMLDDGPAFHLRGSGGIHSTALDMLKWHRALKGDAILTAKIKEQYFAPHVDEGYGDSFYAYGWVNWTTDWNTRLLSHNGGNGYFGADCHRYVEDDVFLFVASNGDVKAWDLMDRIEAIAFDCD